MIRIRFHGRGGHGVKTASRVVGTAAFLAGYQAQDSPVYGAERRGAAVVAFTRISSEPILERGVITHPDLIVIADDTLCRDPAAHVLAGQEAASAVFVNVAAGQDVQKLASEFGITAPLVLYDITGRTLEELGRAAALSAGLGAAAARLAGVIDEPQLVESLREEFEHLQVPAEDIDKNIRVARDVFAAVQPARLEPGQAVLPGAMAAIPHAHPVLAAPSVLDVGNAMQQQTGAWRVERPIVNREACTRCGLCFVECPDGAISLDDEGYPVIDYDHCKGCMICRHLCPLHAIDHEMETRAW